jgi:hypothetical protein
VGYSAKALASRAPRIVISEIVTVGAAEEPEAHPWLPEVSGLPPKSANKRPPPVPWKKQRASRLIVRPNPWTVDGRPWPDMATRCRTWMYIAVHSRDCDVRLCGRVCVRAHACACAVTCACLCVCVCVCVCACVRARTPVCEREEGEGSGKRGRERERETVCVCVCVCPRKQSKCVS